MKKALIAIVPFIFFTLALFMEPPFLNSLEQKSVDARFKWRPPIKASGEVVVVAIDEKSLHIEGRWPWNRATIARLVDGIENLKPKAIGMDIVFSESSPDDNALINSLAKTKYSVLGYYFYKSAAEIAQSGMSPEALEKNFEIIKPSSLPQLDSLSPTFKEMTGAVTNMASIAQATTSQGYFNTLPDTDGVIRKTPLFLSYHGHSFPSLALNLYAQYKEGYAPLPIFNETGDLLGVNLKEDFIPTNSHAAFWINYTGLSEAFQIISATDILNGTVNEELIRDKLVLIGATAIGIYDLRVTPLSPVSPGVFVQAEIIDTLVRQNYLTLNEWTQLASLAAMALMTLLIYQALSRFSLFPGLMVSLGIIFLYAIFALQCFKHGYILAMVYPILNASIVTFSKTAMRGLSEEFEKRKIRRIFQSYLHPDVIEDIIKNPEKLSLGGSSVTCTILFSDVRSFTSISEKMEPETLVAMMNEYFDPISKEIIECGGYIDKFIGDAVMAVFGTPRQTDDHPQKACEAALRMMKKVGELEPIFQKKYGIENFKIGVGVHTGKVIVGNMGTKERLNYTVMGDSVNLAARLESSTKEMKTDILISDATYQKVRDVFSCTYLDEIHVKGKEIGIKVYALNR